MHGWGNNMETVGEYEKRKSEERLRMTQTNGNGISCPACQNEMYDNSPDVRLLSSPPQKQVRCAQCGYQTSVTA
jgi:hypothetical protein